jgi:penicillin amidase
MNGYRARRLEELINPGGNTAARVSLEDCQRFQMDFYSIAGREMVSRLATFQTSDPDAALSLRLLREWDGWLTAGSVGGAVYQVFLNRLAQAILDPKLDAALRLEALGQGAHPLLQPATEFYGYWPLTCMRMLDNPTCGWLSGLPSRDAVLSRSLAETTRELRRLLGEPEAWSWGLLHQVSFPHAMSELALLDPVFGQGPIPIGGDTDTVCQTAIAPDRPYHNNAFSVSYRQVVDLGNLGNSRAMYAPGQSGHLGSPHYGNMIDAWANGRYFPMTWERQAVDIAALHSLTLTPPAA